MADPHLASPTSLRRDRGTNEEHAMSPTAIPARITIDFRDAMHPSRTWILGFDDDAPRRVELLAFDAPIAPSLGSGPVPALPRTRPTALSATCSCPEFCERDHANE
jgi:hypothetical protein